MLVINKYTFKEIYSIKPQEVNGAIYTYSPQARYNNIANKTLHRYGSGNFCKFSVSKQYKNLAGLYILVVEDEIVYIGKCVNLSSRFNTGYGNISPRNCFIGGQSTNCKINKNILFSIKKGKDGKLSFLENNSNQSEIEKELIQKLQPKWNSQLKQLS